MSATPPPPAGFTLKPLVLDWSAGDTLGNSRKLNQSPGSYAFKNPVIPEPAADDAKPVIADEFSIKYYTSEALHKHSTEIAASVEASYGFASMKASTKYLYETSKKAHSVFAVYDKHKLTSFVFPPMDNFQLKEEATQLSGPTEFYEKYGYWYLAGIQYGVAFTGVFRLTAKESSSQSSLLVQAEVVVNASASGKASAEYKDAKEELNKTTNWDCEAKAFGFEIDIPPPPGTGVPEEKPRAAGLAKEPAGAGVAVDPADLLAICNSMVNLPMSNKVYGLWRPFNQLPNWPDAWQDDGVMVPSDLVYQKFWKEISALDILEAHISDYLAQLPSEPKGVTRFRFSNDTDGSEAIKHLYCVPFTVQSAQQQLQQLQNRVTAAQLLLSPLNLLQNPVTTNAPAPYQPSDFTAQSLQQFFVSARQEAQQWNTFFVAETLRTEFNRIVPGLPLSDIVGDLQPSGGRYIADTYAKLQVVEMETNGYAQLDSFWLCGYYSVYGVALKHKTLEQQLITSDTLGGPYGPGGNSFAPYGADLNGEYITSLTVRYGLAEKGDTDSPLCLHITFNTNKQNQIGVGTGDPRGTVISVPAPPGHCLHGLIAKCGDKYEIYGLRCIWIPIDQALKPWPFKPVV